MNFAVAGADDAPALLLIPGQTESWWGYEAAITRLATGFRVHAVDLRGQGRSSRTPGRYSLDTWGSDLVRFIQQVIGRPTVVAGHSSGGVLAAWLAAYAPTGLVRGACCEDPPLFSSEVTPAVGPSIRQSAVGALLALFARHLGDQWSVGDWSGLRRAASQTLPPAVSAWIAGFEEPPQALREYDPEWARAFWSGTATAGCDHRRMLARARARMLLTHHFRAQDPETGMLLGAASDLQMDRARALIAVAGQRVDYRSFPDRGHTLHADDPALYAETLAAWAASLPPQPGA